MTASRRAPRPPSPAPDLTTCGAAATRGGPHPQENPMPVIPHPYGTFLAIGALLAALTYLFVLVDKEGP